MELYVNVTMSKTIRLNHYSSFTAGVSVHVVLEIYFFLLFGVMECYKRTERALRVLCLQNILGAALLL
jgi:hypothetical protein